MGESLVGASIVEAAKMGETAASVPALQVSVSFGRFDNDSLSWEKFSSFSPNKYLEEVEKYATPGSVAQKKAYFEAHYRMVAARKAELMDQERQMEDESLRSYDQVSGDLMGKTCERDSEFDTVDCGISPEIVKQETKLDRVSIGHVVEPDKEDPGVSVECEASLSEVVKEEVVRRFDSAAMNEPEEAPLDKEEVVSIIDSSMLNEPDKAPLAKEEETPPEGSEAMSELPNNLNKKESIPITELPKESGKAMEILSVTKMENVKLDRRNERAKIASSSNVRDVTRVKKKPASSMNKVPQMPTPKVLKPVSNSTALLTSRSSTKKEDGSLLPKSKNPPVVENKKVAPKSLLMSLSVDLSSSDKAFTTTPRKSFIMEKMADKDIVKRAFKTFQNNYSQLKSSAEQRSLGAKQVPIKTTEVKVSTSTSQRKENKGSPKASGVDKRTVKPAPSSFGLRSVERPERGKGFLKNSDEKSNAKEVERTQLHTKSKVMKETEIKKLRHSLNFKATPMPSFNRGPKISKGPLDKAPDCKINPRNEKGLETKKTGTAGNSDGGH